MSDRAILALRGKPLSALAEAARALDAQDPLRHLADDFLVPPGQVYLCGNSLGLQPKATRAKINAELDTWARMGVAGHFSGLNPWADIDSTCVASMARVVGAQPSEVGVMNSLTVNLHLLLVSFYRPIEHRRVLLIEKDAFPSDRFAVESHVASRGLDPAQCIRVARDVGTEAMLEEMRELGDALALVMVGGVHYLTGVALNIAALTVQAHAQGALVGFDLAHAAGNVRLRLHDDGVDFAVWCGYKYLNAGPGGLASVFVHDRHHGQPMARFHGWWGSRTRFKMTLGFDAEQGAKAWQLSNPPVFQMVALRASLDVFDRVPDLAALFAKSRALTLLLEVALECAMPRGCYEVLNPVVATSRPTLRGAQLSLRFAQPVAKAVNDRLARRGFVCDERDPDVLRVSPVPLYSSYAQVVQFAGVLAEEIAALTGSRL